MLKGHRPCDDDGCKNPGITHQAPSIMSCQVVCCNQNSEVYNMLVELFKLDKPLHAEVSCLQETFSAPAVPPTFARFAFCLLLRITMDNEEILFIKRLELDLQFVTSNLTSDCTHILLKHLTFVCYSLA